jgi:hypothetical protein
MHHSIVAAHLVISPVLAVVVTMAGCGGSLSQDDLRRVGIRRPSDEDDDKQPAATQTKTIVAGNPHAKPPTTSGKKLDNSADFAPGKQPETHPEDKLQPPPSSGDAAAESTTTADVQPSGVTGPQHPSEPLGTAGRRQRTIENLRNIGLAFEQYVKKNGRYPAPAIYGPGGEALLSWRVELLPYLGHEALHRQFQLDQPWDSPHNLPLLERIPLVYQSPDRFDETTNYLVPVGSATVFPGQQGLTPRRIEDGVDNTVVLLEVDDQLACAWTKPEDYNLNAMTPPSGLGELRQGGFFVVFGGGRVRQIGADASLAQMKGVLSIDDGDALSYSEVSMPASSEVAAAVGRADPAGVPIVESAVGDQIAAQPSAISTGGPRADIPAHASAPKHPVPDEDSQARSMKLLKDAYQSRYDAAKSPALKQAMVQEMLGQARQMDAGSADRFVLLRVALHIAVEVGDTSSIEQALTDLDQSYQVDLLSMRSDVLRSLAKQARGPAAHEYVFNHARRLIDTALAEDQFETANKLHEIAAAAGRRARNHPAVRELAGLRREINALEREYQNVKSVLNELDGELSRGRANRIAGQYYCFFKGQWDKGLPMLAEADEPRLQHLAQIDSSDPTDPGDQVRLADGWWELADQFDATQQRHIRQRAVHWYGMALPHLVPGLLKSKVEIRLNTAPRFPQAFHGEQRPLG